MRPIRSDYQATAVPDNALVELHQDVAGHADARTEPISVNDLGRGKQQAVTATVGGGTTGLIDADATWVEITCDTATKQVSLPAASNGKVLHLRVIANGCELISSVAADKVNNVVVGATNEAALVAGTLYTLRYVAAANNWVMTGLTALGAVETPVVPDAL